MLPRAPSKQLLSCVYTSKRHNAIFDSDDLNGRMMVANIMDSSVGGCANAARGTDNNSNNGGAIPTDRWCASMLKSADIGCLQERLTDSIRGHVKIIKKHGRIPRKGLTVAVDMHLIYRYDKKPSEELTRSRYKGGTRYFERYMTMQCVDDGIRLNLGAAYLKMTDFVPDLLRVLLESVRDLGVKVKMLLLDREFFSVNSIGLLQKHGVPFLVPCRNTGNVVAALREFAQGRRGNISDNIIEGNDGSVAYHMVITKRKKIKKPEKPEEEYIGFATNVSTQDTRRYAARWGIETGYRLVEEMRPKTRIKDVSARMLCFYYALVAYNEWVILRMLCSDGSGRQSALTQLVFKSGMETMLIQEPKPPP